MTPAFHQATQTLFRWEQDGRGGEHGDATFFPGTIYEVSVQMRNFKEAHMLQLAVEQKLKHTRWDARVAILAEIARIRP
jgi:hypothetical protein